jgi:hypothetical protein
MCNQVCLHTRSPPIPPQLIDFIINTHPALSKAQEQAKESGKGLFDFLEDKLQELKKARGVSSTSERGRDRGEGTRAHAA